MNNRRSLKDIVHTLTVKYGRSLSLRRLSTYVGLSLGALVLAVALLILVFGAAILNGYGKGKVEQAFAKACPGYLLRIGELNYAVGANCLVARSVTLSGTNSTLKVGRISLTGVRWAKLLLGTTAPADVLAKASLDATNLNMEFFQSRYRIRCARLRASVPDSNLILIETKIRPLVGDEELFAADAFRTTRFRVVVPECKVLGLEYGELLQGKSYRAKSVHFYRPSFDALADRYKPVAPFVKSPLMVHEALAAIHQPLQIDTLRITNGYVKYSERAVATDAPGVLTFTAVNLSVKGIANRREASAADRGETSSAILLQGQGNLMDAGVLKVQMTIPVNSPDFSYHYSGSLSGMDLTRLDAFLDYAEHTRISSGHAQAASFEIDVTAGQARGYVRAIYENLKIALLDKQTRSENGLVNLVDSFLANLLKIRSSNAPDASGSMKQGKVNHTKEPDETFLQFTWFALRSGVLDAISH